MAKIPNNVYGIRKPGIRDKNILSANEDSLEQFEISSNNIKEVLYDDNCKILIADIAGTTDSGNDFNETITYSRISEEALVVDKNPIAILTEGWMFDGFIDLTQGKKISNTFMNGPFEYTLEREGESDIAKISFYQRQVNDTRLLHSEIINITHYKEELIKASHEALKSFPNTDNTYSKDKETLQESLKRIQEA